MRSSIKPVSLKKIILMHTAIKVPLRSLNPALVQDWQEKYPNAEVSAVLHPCPKQAPLSEQGLLSGLAFKNISPLDTIRTHHL